MKLKDKYPRNTKEARMVLQREKLIIKKIRDAEVSVPGAYSVDSVGKYATRAFIYPDEPKDTKVLAAAMGELFDVAWELDFRKDSGKFMYIGRKEDYWGEGQSLIIMVEDVPTPANCKIVETQKKVKCFEKKCDAEEVNV